MKTQTNLTIAKLRKFLLVTALVICPVLAFQNGNAQSVATATLTSGGLNNISIAAGGSFTLTLAVTTNFVSGGYTVFLQSNNGSGLFSLSNRMNLNPIFNDPTAANPFPNMAAATLMPSNQFDLGYTGDQITNQPAGTFNLQSLLVTVSGSAAPGVYTIFLDNRSIMTDRTGGGFADVNMGGVTGPMFTVTVIPEPTTVGLVLLGGGALLVGALRKKRAQA